MSVVAKALIVSPSPSSGTSWRASSIMIWCRCPAVRELILDFWMQGGDCLELSIDASAEVVAALCIYVHSGILSLPSDHDVQQELIQVASELGMLGLHRSANQWLSFEANEQMKNDDVVDNVTSFEKKSIIAQNNRNYQHSNKSEEVETISSSQSMKHVESALEYLTVSDHTRNPHSSNRTHEFPPEYSTAFSDPWLNTELQVGAQNGYEPQLFTTNMSLQPARRKTEAEKRYCVFPFFYRMFISLCLTSGLV